jgi:putative membrane protein
MNIDWAELLSAAISSVLFTSIGLVFFAISFMVITKMVPFSMRKEIEEDQNVALGVILGAVIIGIAIIVSSALAG